MDAIFEEVLKKAEKELNLAYYDSKPKNIYALIEFSKEPLYRPKIITFLSDSFEILRIAAYNQKIAEDKLWNDGYETSVMVNYVIFSAIVKTIAIIGEKEFAPLLRQEFSRVKKAFHGLQLERGTVAIALSLLDFDGEIDEIEIILDKAVSNEYNIDQNRDVLEMLYAYCILKKDKTRALDYLANNNRTRNLALVAAALADLDAKEALPILNLRLSNLNPVTKEAFLEAIIRLEIQNGAPITADRMIWMFGKKTAVEMSLGTESDNEFVERANRKKSIRD